MVEKYLDFEPFVLYKNKNIFFYNKSFFELNLDQSFCYEQEINSNIDILDKVYSLKKEVVGDFDVFVFSQLISNVQKNKLFNFNDLGVLSSSIAHELNNPLASIVAISDLLLCEEEFNSKDEVELIEDIKKATLRCSDLINTFLGFSKEDIKINEEENNSIEASYNQATKLFRTKVIEANYFFNFEYETTSKFSVKINSSLISMCFYLLFNEIMLSIHKKSLIGETFTKDIMVKLIETKNSLVLKVLPAGIFMGQESFNDKLIYSLVRLLELELTIKHKLNEISLEKV